MSFGKMATLLFGLAGLLALVSFTVLPAAPSLGGGSSSSSSSGGHVVTSHTDPSEDPAINANRRLEEARARRAALPVDFGAAPGEAVSFGDPASPTAASTSDELPSAGQDRVPQQPGAAPGQPAAPRAPQVQAAPPVSFVPGQPMIDTNPSR
uniref:hypothetical protein n=1 Tax=Sphingomonas bacterium TaxID=1895847 RepID=UPI002631FCE3|nr:hypothetical protein [Sphingomonas bacterium]